MLHRLKAVWKERVSYLITNGETGALRTRFRIELNASAQVGSREDACVRVDWRDCRLNRDALYAG